MMVLARFIADDTIVAVPFESDVDNSDLCGVPSPAFGMCVRLHATAL